MFDPGLMSLISIALAILIPVISATVTIITCGTTMAAIGTKNPELLSRLIITVVLGEALAIYGLLIAFMLISKLPIITTAETSNIAFVASGVISATTVLAGTGISYCGTSLAGAMAEKPESFSSLVIGVVLSEALAIYGLLIAFMLIGQI